MNNPIVERFRANIQDPRTAEYFGEVLSCYYSGNLRSAVVMLYSTVICDLIYKLEELRDVYNDAGARKILEEIEKQQKSNPKSTDWEIHVPEKCKDGNKILTIADYSNFCSLQQLRHLCAHPVLSEKKELYRPNSDIVMGHIRNMLEGVFIKPAFQTKALFDIFIEDVASVKDILIQEERIEKYVTEKYLNRFNDIELEYYLFKTIWRFVFKLSDENCNDNRNINEQVLRILVKRHKDIFLERFERDNKYFSENIEENDLSLLRRFILFLNVYPEFWDKLPKYKQIQILGIIEKDNKYDLKELCLFKEKDVLSHIYTASYLNHFTAIYFVNYLFEFYDEPKALDYCVKLYSSSDSFDRADWNFSDFINPNIKKFTIEQLTEIVRAINNNDQLYGRMRARSSNQIIRDRISELDKNFNYSLYPNFR